MMRVMVMVSAAALAAAVSTASETEVAKANALFERAFQETLERSPLLSAQLGYKYQQDRWPDFSEAGTAEELSRQFGYVAELERTVDASKLDARTRRSYQLFVDGAAWQARSHRFRFHNYPVSFNRGLQSTLPSTLTAQHRIETEADAVAYVARLRGLERAFDQLAEGLVARRDRGIVPPRWTFAPVTTELERALIGEPLDASSQKHELWEDFQTKLGRVNSISAARKAQLLDEARSALRGEVKRGYTRLLDTWRRLESVATDDDGVWKFPDGDAFYAHLVQETTTTSMTPDEVHRLGLSEMARIRAEMQAILPKVGFTGSVEAFFEFLKKEDRFYLPASDDGRTEYLTRANGLIEAMWARLPELFNVSTKAPLVVRAIPLERARNAGFAGYSRGSLDGTRPSVVNVNLYDMRQMPLYQIPALAYHEGIPGHHLQQAVAQELTTLPTFRRFARFPAYLEGWGLYCEDLPLELGLYADPYDDFGRLNFQLLRAARLVADTGIHAKRWTRREAVDYLLANTPMTEAEALRETGRYITNPTQAIAYTVGQIRIRELRKRAETALGDRFDVRAFHDVILGEGQLPLDMLATAVDEWIATVKASAAR